MEEDRIICPGLGNEDVELETNLRPRTLSEYIGQEKVKENLKIL